MPRLTRREQRARTRAALLDAAAAVLAESGLDGASIDAIAARAGYTKGAFYANFASKEELFLTLLDRHFAERLDELDRIASRDRDPVEQAREAGETFAAALRGEPASKRLFFEFAGRAARDERFRHELLTRYRAMRARVAAIYAARAERAGLEPGVPPDTVAAMTTAMVDGLALQALIDPDAVPDALYGTLLAIFFTGLRQVASGARP